MLPAIQPCPKCKKTKNLRFLNKLSDVYCTCTACNIVFKRPPTDLSRQQERLAAEQKRIQEIHEQERQDRLFQQNCFPKKMTRYERLMSISLFFSIISGAIYYFSSSSPWWFRPLFVCLASFGLLTFIALASQIGFLRNSQKAERYFRAALRRVYLMQILVFILVIPISYFSFNHFRAKYHLVLEIENAISSNNTEIIIDHITENSLLAIPILGRHISFLMENTDIAKLVFSPKYQSHLEPIKLLKSLGQEITVSSKNLFLRSPMFAQQDVALPTEDKLLIIYPNADIKWPTLQRKEVLYLLPDSELWRVFKLAINTKIVVVISETAKKTSEYDVMYEATIRKIPGYTLHWTADVVNLTTQQHLAQEHFVGADPPFSVTVPRGTRTVHGKEPVADLQNWLTTLRKR